MRFAVTAETHQEAIEVDDEVLVKATAKGDGEGTGSDLSGVRRQPGGRVPLGRRARRRDHQGSLREGR
jgi:hypothetical protein